MEKVKILDDMVYEIIKSEEKIVELIKSSDESSLRELCMSISISLTELEKKIHPCGSRDYEVYLFHWIKLHRRDIKYNIHKNYPLIFNFDEEPKYVTAEDWRDLDFLRYNDLTDDEQLDGMSFHENGLDL
jgi:hypothetical protein